jgi:hypothetical protein
VSTLLEGWLADAKAFVQGPEKVAAKAVAPLATIAVPGRCHFASDGYLRGPIKITHVMTPNYYRSGFGEGFGVVEHTEAGYEQGTVATFLSSASEVSAFFSIARGGTCHQYLPVGRDFQAWSQVAGNANWRGVEDEDRTHPSIPLTTAQMATFAQILEACSAYDGFPLQVTNSTSGRGLITHAAGGEEWGGHTGCPGSVRAAQRPAMVELAKHIRNGVRTMAYTADGTKSLRQIADQEKASPSWLLRLTAVHDGKFPDDVSAYVNDVFSAKIPPTTPMPKGCVLRLPAK